MCWTVNVRDEILNFCKRCHGRRRRFSVFTCHLKCHIDSRWETWFGTKSYRSHLDRKVSFERVADVLFVRESLLLDFEGRRSICENDDDDDDDERDTSGSEISDEEDIEESMIDSDDDDHTPLLSL